MFDIVDRCGQRTFIIIHNAARHVVGGQTGEAPNYANDGDADIRENIDRRPDRGEGAIDLNQDRHNHKRIGAPERQSHDG